MEKQTAALPVAAMLTVDASQAGYSAGIDTRIERWHDAVENTAGCIDD